jgi:hypothetical protein
MPIKNLTDEIEAGMPRIGKLRKGAKKPGPNEIGKDLTYFRFDCGDDPQLTAAFEAAYGLKPRVINVFLPYDTIEDNFPTWREERGKHSLIHRCDGETMVLWQDEQGLYHREPKRCPYADLPDGDPNRKCVEKGTLHIIIPELMVVQWGYIEVRTGSKWDCIELSRNLAEVRNRAHQISLMKGQTVTMQFVPCILRRGPRMTSCPVNGKRILQEKWLLTLEIEPEYFQNVLKATKLFALPMQVPQLEAPIIELDYDPGDTNGGIEYPETEILDDEPEPEEEPQPQASNGNNGDVPKTGPDLLAYVNQRSQVPYDNLLHLRVALHNEGLEGKAWPAYQKDPGWWQQALDIALAHAEAKAKQEEQEELPF